MEHTYLAKVKSSDPEEFLFVTFDPTKGSIKHMTNPVSEADIREHLSANGMPKAEIDSKFEHARQHPV